MFKESYMLHIDFGRDLRHIKAELGFCEFGPNHPLNQMSQGNFLDLMALQFKSCNLAK